MIIIKCSYCPATAIFLYSLNFVDISISAIFEQHWVSKKREDETENNGGKIVSRKLCSNPLFFFFFFNTPTRSQNWFRFFLIDNVESRSYGQSTVMISYYNIIFVLATCSEHLYQYYYLNSLCHILMQMLKDLKKNIMFYAGKLRQLRVKWSLIFWLFKIVYLYENNDE